MVEVLQSLVEIAFFLLQALIFAVPLTIVVWVFSRLSKRLGEKFKLSWIKAAALSTFVAVFILVLVLYLIPFLEVQEFAVNDSLPPEIRTQFVERNGDIVEEPLTSNPIVDSISSSIITLLRLVFVAGVLTLLLLPLELLSALVFAKLEKKRYLNSVQMRPFHASRGIGKSANIPAFYAATLSGFIIACAVILLFPWIPAGLLYLVYFS